MMTWRPPGWSRWRLFWAWWVPTRAVLVMFSLLYRFRREGMHHLPDRGPFIVIANHQSHFDPPLVAAAVRERPVGFLARETLFDSKIFGRMIAYFGAIPIRRSQGASSGIRASSAELKAGRSMLLFPEGSRSFDGCMDEFQGGIHLLVRRSGAMVIPAAVEGAFDVWPRQSSKPRLGGVIHVRIGEPISAEAFLEGESEEGLERLRRTIETMRLELRADIRKRTGGRYPPPGPGDTPYWETASDSDDD